MRSEGVQIHEVQRGAGIRCHRGCRHERSERVKACEIRGHADTTLMWPTPSHHP